jgi:Rieske Fe-S protein
MTGAAMPGDARPHSGVLAFDHDALTRRGFLSSSAMALIAATLAACGDSATGPRSDAPLPSGVAVAGRVMTISLATQTALASTGGFVVTANAATNAYVIVINLGSNTYRAFSSICTHEGCIVSGFSGNVITCNCHGSQFTTTGQVAVGPAPRALAQFGATYNAGANTVTVSF